MYKVFGRHFTNGWETLGEVRPDVLFSPRFLYQNVLLPKSPENLYSYAYHEVILCRTWEINKTTSKDGILTDRLGFRLHGDLVMEVYGPGQHVMYNDLRDFYYFVAELFRINE